MCQAQSHFLTLLNVLLINFSLHSKGCLWWDALSSVDLCFFALVCMCFASFGLFGGVFLHPCVCPIFGRHTVFCLMLFLYPFEPNFALITTVWEEFDASVHESSVSATEALAHAISVV